MSIENSYEEFDKGVSAIINSKEAEELEIADSFFLQQILVRRFKKNNPEDFEDLVRIRTEVENLLINELLPYCPFTLSLLETQYIVNAVMALMHECSKNWYSSLSHDDIHNILVQRILEKHSETWDLELKEELVEVVKNYILINQERFNIIVEQSNYFDFYSPLEMTLEVDGLTLLKIYCTAFCELETHANLNMWSRFTLDETKWLYAYDSGNHEREYFFYLGFPMYKSNVHIIINEGNGGDQDNQVYINDIETKDSIYLKIPLNESPKMLDRKLEQLKQTLQYYYQENKNVVGNNFIKQSKFFKCKFKNSRCLIKEKHRSMFKVIYSVACWDLSNNSKEMTVNQSIDELYKELRNINDELEYCDCNKNFIPYNKDSSKKYYDWIASLIKGRTSDVDYFLTGEEEKIIGG